MRELVLSLFPGPADGLGRGFESAGFCVVRGPDLVWDQRIEDFRGIPGRFDGVIGGPPCQQYSMKNRRRNPADGDRLVLEFLRVVRECRPAWFLMENVAQVPTVRLDPYVVQRTDLTDQECGGRQYRLRHIQFGSLDGSIVRPERKNPRRRITEKTVLTKPLSPGDTITRRKAKQGLRGVQLRALTVAARSRAIGNAVPLAIAESLAAAVSRRSVVTSDDCVCGCGRRLTGRQLHATDNCRKRMQLRRDGYSGDGFRVLTLE